MSMVPHAATMLGTSARKAASSRSAEVAAGAKITTARPTNNASLTTLRVPISFLSLSVAAARTPQCKSFLRAVFGYGRVLYQLSPNTEKLRANLAEGDANAEIGLRVDNGSGRFKEFALAINLDLDLGILRQGIGHVQVAAVQAELGHPRGDAGLRGLVHHFSSGDKRITRRSATLISHAILPGRQLPGFYP